MNPAVARLAVQWLPATVAGSVLAFASYVAYRGTFLPGLLTIVTLAGAALVWARPRYGLTLLILLIFFVDWMTEELGLLPHAVTWSIEGILVLLTLRALTARFPRHLRHAATDPAVIALIVTGVISSLAHNQPAVRILLGLRAVFRFILMYYVLLNLPLSERTWRGAIKLVMLLMFAQIPIAIYQWGILGRTDDQVFGSLRSTGVLSVLSIMLICILVGWFLKMKARLRYLAGAAVFFVVPVLGEAKGFFLLLPIGLAVLLWRELLRRPVLATCAGATVGLCLYVALTLFPKIGGNADLLELATDPRQALQIASSEARVAVWWERNPADVTIAASTWPRLLSLRDAAQEIWRDSFTTLFGFGIGSRTFTYEEVRAQTSIILYKAPIATRLYELGYVGLAFYWLIFVGALLPVRSVFRCRDRYWRAMAFAFPAIVFLYVVSDFYTDALNDPLAFGFWFFAAALARQAERCRARPQATPLATGTQDAGRTGDVVNDR